MFFKKGQMPWFQAKPFSYRLRYMIGRELGVLLRKGQFSRDPWYQAYDKFGWYVMSQGMVNAYPALYHKACWKLILRGIWFTILKRLGWIDFQASFPTSGDKPNKG